jgi:prevent-host-death family protein
MSKDLIEVSAFDAKTRLSELLRQTEAGRSFLIRRRGRAVARLLPVDPAEAGPDPGRLSAAFREVRSRVRGRVSVRRLIDEGRRR